MDEVTINMSQSTIKGGVSETAIKDKGQQLADLLRPNTFGLYNGNPHTLSEWLIYVIAWPIFAPLTWLAEIARWLMVATRFTVWHILGMIGIQNVQPLMDTICNELGPNNPLYPLFNMLRDPDSEFGAAIIDQAIGGAVAMGVNRILDPLMRPVGFALEETLMNQELPSEVYVSGVRKGVIAWDNYIQGMRRYGFNPEMSQKLFNSLKLAPSIGETLDMLNRGIIDDGTANTYLLMNDYTADINEHLKELRWYVPTAQDVVQFAVREVYTPEIISEFGHDQEFPNEALRDAQAAGLSPEKFKLYWNSHWRYPSPEQIYDMMHRGVIDSSTVTKYLKMQDYSPYWREKMEAISYRPFTRVDVRRMFKTGVLNESEVKKSYMDIGYTDEKAAKLTEYTVLSQSPVDKMLTLPQILTAYKDGLIDEDSAKALVKALGYSDYDVQLQILMADIQKKGNITSLVERLAKTEYNEGVMSLDDAMSMLREYGVNESRVQLLAELWPLEQQHSVKGLNESDLRSAYALGLIGSDEFRYGLLLKNYSEWATDIIISLENIQLSPTRVGGIPAGISTTGAIKTFTKAELKSMLLKGLISASEWAYQMALLGYSSEQISLYAELIMQSQTKTAS